MKKFFFIRFQVLTCEIEWNLKARRWHLASNMHFRSDEQKVRGFGFTLCVMNYALGIAMGDWE